MSIVPFIIRQKLGERICEKWMRDYVRGCERVQVDCWLNVLVKAEGSGLAKDWVKGFVRG